jgi:hypothetical protein
LALPPLQAFAPTSNDTAVTFVTFDGTPKTTHHWQHMDDPVMGGKSVSTFGTENGMGVFDGTCAIVPFLKAPGFCKVATTHKLFQPARFADASGYIDGALYLEVASTTPAYKGFKIELLAKNVTRPRPGMHHSAPSFKADFAVPAHAEAGAFSTVRVPFSAFSVDWSDYTGECDTKDPTGEQHLCCTPEHPEVCMKVWHLRQITGFAVWAEGVEGDFAIDLKSIAAGP